MAAIQLPSASPGTGNGTTGNAGTVEKSVLPVMLEPAG